MSESINHSINRSIVGSTTRQLGQWMAHGGAVGGMARTMLMCVSFGVRGEAGVLFGGGRGKAGPVPSEGQATVRGGGCPHPCLGAPLPSAALTARPGSWSLHSSTNL